MVDGKLPLEMFKMEVQCVFPKQCTFFLQPQKERDSKQDGIDKHLSLTEPVRAVNSVIVETQFSVWQEGSCFRF